MTKLYFYICAFLILSGVTMVAFADHNSGVEGYNPHRGYNKDNCDKLYSKTTNKQAEWLGHRVGCLLEIEAEGQLKYILIMEYRVKTLSIEMGNELKELIKEYTGSKGIEM